MDDNENKVDGKEKNKKQPKLPNVLEPGFVAPDGGWGWMIVIASGFSNFCTLSVVLSFGLLFRERFQQLGINIAQATSISSINSAVTACTGLSNGPLFRKYSYRQVSFFGALLCALSTCVLSFMKTFHSIVICYSIFYAIGNSLCMNAYALSLNTYFKKKRRIAVSLAWTCTGLAPIILPQIIMLLLPIYDVSGTILLFGGMIFNAVACALLLQPVSKHAKKESNSEGPEIRKKIDSIKENDDMCRTLLTGSIKALPVDKIWHRGELPNMVQSRMSQRFGSQYIHYDDEEQESIRLDVIDSGTPMMSRANDGWYAKLNFSNISLASNKTIKKDSTRHQTSVHPQSLEMNEHCENMDNKQKQTIDDYTILNNGNNKRENLLETINDKKDVKQTWYMRALYAVGIFFDLDLLQDFIFVNIMTGITLANVADIGLFQLMPFILSDNLSRKNDVANIMSVLAIVDVMTRLMIPFIATAIRWENRSFYLVAIAILTMCRMILAYVTTYDLLMATAIISGAGKAFRQVFVSLIIPTYVPLERLPAATGLTLTAGGITFLAFGPIVGWIRDICGDYTMPMHFLNCFTYLAMIFWAVEFYYSSMKKKRLVRNEENSGSSNVNN